jgi:2-keto-4-pentenoate hydratase
MMTGEQLTAAADLLWEHWQEGRRLESLPAAIRPSTRAEGYAIQARLEARAGRPLYGWKIAATSTAGQKHIGVDGPLAGRLLRERAYESGAAVPFGRNHMRVAEAEFAFRIGVDLPPRRGDYTIDEVTSAVATLHPAIEIPDSRYDDFARVGAAQLIADNACAHYFVLGAAAPETWRDVDLAAHRVTGTVSRRGPTVPIDTADPGAGRSPETPATTHEGRGSNVLGDPRVALAWLVNEVSRLGLTLRAGEVVTTGTCVAPLEISAGDHLMMDFGALGRVDATLRDDG